MKRCSRIGWGIVCARWSPSSRAPVPQSRMITVPSEARTSTQEVLPPKRAVLGPGAAIDPRVPQKRTCMADSLIIPCRPRRISSTNSGGLGSPMPSEGGRTPGLESSRAPGPLSTPRYRPRQRVTVPRGLGVVEEFQSLNSQTEKPVKATCPGPVTLSIHVQLRPGDAYGNDRLALCWDFVPAINAELRALVEAGADYLQLDEPSAAVVPGQIGEDVKMFKACGEGVRARTPYPLRLGDLPSPPRGQRPYRRLVP